MVEAMGDGGSSEQLESGNEEGSEEGKRKRMASAPRLASPVHVGPVG
jgi:hypothetical protein